MLERVRAVMVGVPEALLAERRPAGADRWDEGWDSGWAAVTRRAPP
jgi:hypothetical protein